MIFYAEDVLKLILALALGGIVGTERELRDKDAGLRTLMFISVGSAMFTILSLRIAEGGGDPARIAAQVVSGVGFLGAGVIMRERGAVRGLTTAATIWLAAALGLAVGAGAIIFSLLAGGLILLALVIFPKVEHLMGTLHLTRTYVVRIRVNQEKQAALEALIRQHGLTISETRRARHDDQATFVWKVVGRPRQHEILEADLFNDPDVIDLET